MVGVNVSQLWACHWLLLRIAGTAPDDLVHRCRRWLAEGRALDVGRAVTYAVLSQRIRLINADIDLLAELLAADGIDNSALSLVAVDDVDPMPMFGFAASRAGIEASVGIAAADGNPMELVTDGEPADEIERRAMHAVARVPAARAVWRAWRYPGAGAPWPRPRRVWVVETDAHADLAGVTGRIQAALDFAGEIHGQVETYAIGSELPGYQLLARSYGALMWTREPCPPLRIATILNRGPAVDGGLAVVMDRPVLGAWESERVQCYLTQCVPVLVTADRMDDVITTQRDIVPMSLITDGHFVWCEATHYYVERYRLAPDAAFLAHIRAREYTVPVIDGAAVYRATALVQDASIIGQIWSIGP